MDALWRLGQGTAREVLELAREETGWAYTTVKTMLDRLTDKGHLVADRGAAAVLYRPRLERADAQRHAARRLRDRVFGGDPAPLVLCLLEDESLSEGERRELSRRLRALEEDDASPDGEDGGAPG